MSSVKCHYCKADLPLELARPRGGMWPGFMCSDCYSRQFVKAFLVVGGGAVVFFIIAGSIQDLKKSNDEMIKNSPHGFASISDASYSQGEITTRVQEVIPNLMQEFRKESNWQEGLFEPINPSKLNAAGFGYTDALMEPQNVGSVNISKAADTVTFMVKSKMKNYYFRVTQTRVAK